MHAPHHLFVPPAPPPTPPSNRWQCPYCPYVQKNHRTPDLRRHVASHTASAAENVARWVCCGVPLRAAGLYGVRRPVAELEAEGRVLEYAGERMVGGCRKAFSRKDALIRHLVNSAGACVGDAWGEWLVGNKEKRKARA
ncbi:hypothetical protein BD414DRAFT_515850 [Trametes punicea]|nr:hypothetical protein BD414DRAFT_515850 [Trametes punicea]